MKDINELLKDEELMKAVRGVNWDDVINKANLRPDINVNRIDIGKYITKNPNKLDINMVLKKIDRLQELAWKEPVDNTDVLDIELKHNDYIEGLYNGLEIAISLLEDRVPELI